MICPPGSYRAQRDTALLVEVLRRDGGAARRDVLDLCSGPGTVALAAAAQGADSVTAVELSRRSAAAARLNARLHGAAVTVYRGDLFAPVVGRRFDLVTANPPYVPSSSARLPRHRIGRCWDGGPDGRSVIDRLCAQVAGHLRPAGRVLMVHSAVCDTERTLEALSAAGMRGVVRDRAWIPYGPVMRARAAALVARGLVVEDTDTEEIVVIEGRMSG